MSQAASKPPAAAPDPTATTTRTKTKSGATEVRHHAHPILPNRFRPAPKLGRVRVT